MTTVAIVAVLTGSCGGSDRVSVPAYETSVCSAVKGYLADTRANSRTAAAAVSGDPVKGKTLLGDYLDQQIRATDTLVSKLQDAGSPDVPDGDRIAGRIRDAFATAQSGLRKVRSEVEALPTGNVQAFSDAAQKLAEELRQVFDGTGTALDGLKSPELEKAAKANATCQSIGA